MLNRNKMYEAMQLRRPVMLRGNDWEATAKYSSTTDAQAVYFEIIQFGFDASSGVGHDGVAFVNVWLTDDMLAEDDLQTEAIVNGIERHIPDVCEGLEPKECWEEAFHLAHDWLIDHRRFQPEKNEELAIATADRLFPSEAWPGEDVKPFEEIAK